MDVYILNKKFEVVNIIDSYTSFIWTERYAEPGDFELYIPASASFLNNIDLGYYVSLADSSELMIVETISINDEKGRKYVTVQGRSLVSMLERRMSMGTVFYNATDGTPTERKTAFEIIEEVLTDNIINSENLLARMEQHQETVNETLKNYLINNATNRNIPNFIIKAQDDDTDPARRIRDISKSPEDVSFSMVSVYEIVKTLCDKRQFGFKILRQDDKFVMYVYDGVDRTNEIIFSPTFDNISKINRLKSIKDYKTVVMASGVKDNDATEVQAYTVYDIKGKNLADEQTDVSGLDLMEYPIDLTAVKDDKFQNDGSEIPGFWDSYETRLSNKAKSELIKHNKTLDAFECELNNYDFYKLNADYFLGDIVQCIDGFGHANKMRITEVIHSVSEKGYKIFPSMTLWQEDEEDN